MATVTANVKDPQGNVYANAIVIASFIGQNTTPGAGPYVTGGVPSGQFETVIPGSTDALGNMSVIIPGNDTITPAPSTWRWTVVSSNGKVSFAVNISISGASQDISVALQAASASLAVALQPGTIIGNLAITGTLGVTGAATLPSITGPTTIAGALTVGSIDNAINADQQAGADICAKIVTAASLLPSTGGVIDITGLGAYTACTSGTMTLGAAGQQILVRQGASTITTNANPGLKIADGAAVTWVGVSSNSSELLCTNATASAPCVQWIGSRGGMERMWVSTNQNTGVGLILDSSLSTSGVRFNTFKDMRINVSTVNANTQNGVQLNAQDGTHLVSFNNFINVEIVSFSTCYSLTMQGGGSVGPTDNLFLGGQCRETTAGVTGTGINIGQAAQNNWFMGGNISNFVTAINIAAFATTNQNKFFGVIMESNTNSVTIGAGATDNAFIGSLLGTQPFTDNGTRTVLFGDGNNNFGPGGAAIQKQGAPWLNPTLISTNGTVVTINSAATGTQTVTFPNAIGTVFGSGVLSNAQVSAGTPGTPFFQLVRQQATNTTDVIIDTQNNSQALWRVMLNGVFRGFATSIPAGGTAGAVDCVSNASGQLACSYNNGSFFNQSQTIGAGTSTTNGTGINTLTCQAQPTITVTGAAATDTAICALNAALPATWQTGIVLAPPVVTANTVTYSLCNPTATATITPAATVVRCTVTR